MANLAVVFHWPPAAMDPMELEELLRWEKKARDRWTTDE
ncbi:GpE family phage tail protein [Alloalcanivorax xenomutans]